MHSADKCISFILPIKASSPQSAGELTTYLRWLSERVETIVVDGSAPAVFAEHSAAWRGIVHHVAPAADLATPMAKVGGALTGVRFAHHEYIIIADDDVRYDEESLRRVTNALGASDVVRPQNYFVPLPWHARWDTGRILINRMTGGDWPGTLGIRRSVLRATGGYDGRAMFENLELVRTVCAAGGREASLLDTFVERRPPTTRHFLSQRLRQAYDEFARPPRMLAQLAVLPLAILSVMSIGWWTIAAGALIIAGVAEMGRHRANGTQVFKMSASLFAPAWIAERAIFSWLALASRLVLGGVPYRGTVLRHSATSVRVLRDRYASLRDSEVASPNEPRYRSA